MYNQINHNVQSQFDTIHRELVALQNRQQVLQNQQTRLNLLHQFQQHGVIRSDYLGFQPRSRRLVV
ncbi:MAG: hypothetical protein KJ069_14100 [Anaerolineae bacterium]|nr:hypothetical protein [Anaerolineae bacterium]